ncbi:uncharacterized protein LOC114259498 [Camellia sinensis]|uniref:uncharacterized protein LOC114259498 n=1 Tax=Camellia sinensis TaxID=4442 RepID=UPI001035D953|nr:uncharacterized protein LOC114259498 [Camellia sinensis]
MNVCLLMKWWWRYANEEQVLWKQVLVCKYKAEGGNWRPDIHSGGRVSKIWGDILGAANQNVSLLQFYINNLQIRVGNGCRVSFWHDCWTGGASLKESFPRLFKLSNEKDGTLRDYADKRGNSENWVISFRRALFQWEQEELLNLNLFTSPSPVLNLLVKDSVLWLASKSGQSFVSTLYKHTDVEHGEVNNSSRLVWIKYLPPKVQFFGWLAWKHKVKTSVFLHRIGVLEDSAATVCIFCKAEQETVQHVLIWCPSVWRVWTSLLQWWGALWVVPQTVDGLLQWWAGSKVMKAEKVIWNAIAGG